MSERKERCQTRQVVFQKNVKSVNGRPMTDHRFGQLRAVKPDARACWQGVQGWRMQSLVR